MIAVTTFTVTALPSALYLCVSLICPSEPKCVQPSGKP